MRSRVEGAGIPYAASRERGPAPSVGFAAPASGGGEDVKKAS